MTSDILLIVSVIGVVAFVCALLLRQPARPPARARPTGKSVPIADDRIEPASFLERIDVGRNSDLDRRVAQQWLPDPSVITHTESGGVQDIAPLEALLAKSPRNVELMNLVAYHYYCNRKLDEAAALYENGLALKRNDATMLLYLGNTLYLLGQVDRATELWNRVVQVDTDGPLARKAKARLSKVLPASGAGRS